MKPKAIRNLDMVRGPDGLLRLELANAGREVVLDPLAELVWDLSDGSRSFEDLAQAASLALNRVVQREEVFSALDFLADAGLLEERAAPPVAEGKVSRRSLLVQLAPVVGAAAFMMSGGAARAGGLLQNREYSDKESRNKGAESAGKTSESDGKGSLRVQEEISKAGEQNAKQEPHRAWYDANKGRLDQTGKYAVAPNHPLVGTWKYGYKTTCPPPDCEERTLVLRCYSSGIAEGLSLLDGELYNWKYTSTGRDTTGRDTGVLEDFLGERIGKIYLTWITKDEIEFNTPGAIFPRKVFVRQFSSNRRESR